MTTSQADLQVTGILNASKLSRLINVHLVLYDNDNDRMTNHFQNFQYVMAMILCLIQTGDSGGIIFKANS